MERPESIMESQTMTKGQGGEFMLFLTKDYMRKKHYSVTWAGLLEVNYPDFQDQMPVSVASFSGVGALIESEQIYINRRHLIATDQKPELKLKIFTPEGVFSSAVEILWYRWSTEKIMFEIGIKFLDVLVDNQVVMDDIIVKLNRQKICA